MANNNLIKKETLNIHPFSYPILKTNTLLDDNFYKKLKDSWHNFKNFYITSAGQVSRNNI